ncbi:MAG: hypothetical protein US86_C0001G0365 [Candidatus Daviesbacteria bacterium GW2011_GWA2_38_24]|uniref:Uncharacterized protein n=1 Tax=Candidatus Daviesbacteria bacterium GW2011_GWA2_38_24 TaxID=1618422 RepID=A0A0G0JI93_9BACT|nr:MAG: hypothetical protein US86_C0001G0365 [Candidatus Daviesbacteria bacterium GW2011_GWA2_38_24]
MPGNRVEDGSILFRLPWSMARPFVRTPGISIIDGFRRENSVVTVQIAGLPNSKFVAEALKGINKEYAGYQGPPETALAATCFTIAAHYRSLLGISSVTPERAAQFLVGQVKAHTA